VKIIKGGAATQVSLQIRAIAEAVLLQQEERLHLTSGISITTSYTNNTNDFKV
jgi:hypothetical protein